MSDYRDRQLALARQVVSLIEQRPAYRRGNVVEVVLAELPDAGKIWPRAVLAAAVARHRQVTGTGDRATPDGWVAALNDARVHDRRLPDLTSPALRLLLGEPSDQALRLRRAVGQVRSAPVRQEQLRRKQAAEAQLRRIGAQRRSPGEVGIEALQALGLVDRFGRLLVEDGDQPHGLVVTRGQAVGHWSRGSQTLYRADGTTTTLNTDRRERANVRTGAAAVADEEWIRYTDHRGRPVDEGLRVVRRLERDRFALAIAAIMRQHGVPDPGAVIVVECQHGSRLVTATDWVLEGLVGCRGTASEYDSVSFHYDWRGPATYYGGRNFESTASLAALCVAQSETWTSEVGADG